LYYILSHNNLLLLKITCFFWRNTWWMLV
jgi:hypothetical protein